MKYNYAIYHKNCVDGFSSLMVLLLANKLTHDAIIKFDVPSTNNIPKDIENKDIIIMDVAYKYDVLKGIVEKSKSVLFIDHHVTIHDDVEKIKNSYKDKMEIIYDIYESGASLTWKYFFKDKKFPLFIKYVKDNDIGMWKYKETNPFIYCLRVKFDTDLKSYIVKKWFKLFVDSYVKSLVKLGKIYEEYANSLLEENAKRYSLELFPSTKIYKKYSDHFSKPFQYRVAVACGTGCPSSSLLGRRIMETVDCDFCILWVYNMSKKEYIISFRSKKTDVGKIAKIFGGGGHKLASACSFSDTKYHIQDLFFDSKKID